VQLDAFDGASILRYGIRLCRPPLRRTAELLKLFAAAAEVRRIEARYSRYRGDSELARINKVAATGGIIDIDAETKALIAYVKACFAKSDGTFDTTSGLLRTVWDFSASRLPDQSSIDAVLPFFGPDNVDLADIHQCPETPDGEPRTSIAC
jgi:thiamine biosynthesis lipoprotein